MAFNDRGSQNRQHPRVDLADEGGGGGGELDINVATAYIEKFRMVYVVYLKLYLDVSAQVKGLTCLNFREIKQMRFLLILKLRKGCSQLEAMSSENVSTNGVQPDLSKVHQE